MSLGLLIWKRMMKYLKLIFLSFGFIFLIVLYLNNESNKTMLGIIFDSFWINWIIVFYVLLIHLIRNLSFPDTFYRIRKFEHSGIFYKTIGVVLFKYILVNSPIPLFTAKLSLKSKSKNSIIKLDEDMRRAETIHIIAFISSLLIMTIFSYLRDLRFLYFMIVFNIIINLYPFYVQ
jgi:hypothetical protein